MTNPQTAVAWRLHSPSVSGGKYYDVLLFDRYVLIGWGAIQGTVQYKMTVCQNPQHAQQVALAQTTAKESAGYKMHVWPKASQRPAAYWASVLPHYVNHRGGDIVLDEFVRVTLQEGIRLDGAA